MSFVNTKQQRLIEDSVTNHVKYYDKITANYLKLRQSIFKLNASITKQLSEENSIVSDENKVEVYQLRFELDRAIEAYTSHLQELERNLVIAKDIKPPYRSEANSEFKTLQEKEQQLTEEIKDIQEVQKPRLDKMMSLVKSFDSNSKSNTARAMNPYRLRDLDKNEKVTEVDLRNLLFTHEEIVTLFDDVTVNLKNGNENEDHFSLKAQAIEQLNNNKIFEKVADSKYYYKLHRSQLRDVSASMAVHDYDELINTTIAEITALTKQGNDKKENWNKNAHKLEAIKNLLDDMDLEMDSSM
ncbi:predicted protein [Scheffersomyces stipitis CBS 6054]|uniref:Uncharacterized protein n=1 Tax=Scheffersomyces stipitis (strain ATCC 58785 / CBS 6054 / NBRC 10063 / NRRL Y-11545) TaxID=322104 RepID=A3LYZ1_PICST|nr:predicted protein [Scheffersomyces stipitis CBS 6054]ABN68249.2 predicted protein [Scheffersomyces stipitis CBS 6054]KAG2731341.1 hypothetical protein G9P44_005757 [Scheffersomyces stipitis]